MLDRARTLSSVLSRGSASMHCFEEHGTGLRELLGTGLGPMSRASILLGFR